MLTDAAGHVQIDVPRDRDGSFEPQIVRKRQRRLSDVDEVVFSLYAKGLTTGEISAHFADVYGASVSKETVSRITDRVVEEMQTWWARPLEQLYAAVFIDAIMVKIRDGQVRNRPVYAAIGVDLDGHKDILGMWAGDGDGESAKFWMAVLTELRNRGVARCVLRGLRRAQGPAGQRERGVAAGDRADLICCTMVVAGMVPLVTCAVPGRTYADALPSRSTMQTCSVRGGAGSRYWPAGAAPRAPR